MIGDIDRCSVDLSRSPTFGNRIILSLVGSLENVFFHILGIIIISDELICFRGVGIPPTRWCGCVSSIVYSPQLWLWKKENAVTFVDEMGSLITMKSIMGLQNGLPSGKRLQFANLKMAIYGGFTQLYIKWLFSIVTLVYQRVLPSVQW